MAVDKKLSDAEGAQSSAQDDHDQVSKVPDLELAYFRFLMGHRDVDEDKKNHIWREKLMPIIKERQMTIFYRELCSENLTQRDPSLEQRMAAENEEVIKKLDARIEEATNSEGEMELRDALHKKAEFLASIGDKSAALKAFRNTFEKTVGIGNKIDLIFQIIRIGFFYMDHNLISTHVARAKDLMEQGGDWDRKNRLKAYEALYKMAVRDFEGAAELFLDAVPTFSSYELMTYEHLIFYTVICCVLALDRPRLKDKVLKGNEIQEQLHAGGKDGTLFIVKQFLSAFYYCDYDLFFQSLAGLEEKRLSLDRYLEPHRGYYVRNVRVKAYRQYLQPYKSVSVGAMAKAFGVGTDYIDREMHQLISTAQVHARVDAVKQVIETTPYDYKNDQYRAIIRDGDLLLNRIHKLARVINE